MSQKDITQRDLLNCPDVFADVINVLLADGQKVVAPDSLSACTPTSQFKAMCDGKYHEQERDVTKFWEEKGVLIAAFGIENQSQMDKDMPLRVISYDGAAYKEQVLQHDAASKDKTGATPYIPPYPVITLVINYGKSWDDKYKSLIGCIGPEKIPEVLRPYVNDYNINVITIADLTSEELDKFQSDFGEFARLVWSIHHNEPFCPKDSGKDLVHGKKTMAAMSAFAGDNSFTEAYDKISQEENGGVSMCRVVEEIRNSGIEQGKELGFEIFAKVTRAYLETRSVKTAAEKGKVSFNEAEAYLIKCGLLPANQ